MRGRLGYLMWGHFKTLELQEGMEEVDRLPPDAEKSVDRALEQLPSCLTRLRTIGSQPQPPTRTLIYVRLRRRPNRSTAWTVLRIVEVDTLRIVGVGMILFIASVY
ncbi:MAG: hypothetical protein HY709_08535 [Candidatus Latescibacteria bacterium]|nr:hypothetical protein [Candidatus Latescibacterota bacterium]